MKAETAVDIALQLTETALANYKSSFCKMTANDLADFIEALSKRLMALDYKEGRKQRIDY